MTRRVLGPEKVCVDFVVPKFTFSRGGWELRVGTEGSRETSPKC